jgi:hypothetical protein
VWGNQKDGRELSAFANALEPFNEDTLNGLLSRLKASDTEPVRKTRANSKADLGLLSDYVTRLTSATSPEEIVRLATAIRTDKRVRLADLNKISEDITGASRKHKNKAAALAAISQFAMRNIREQGVFASIDRMLGRK